MACLGWGKGPWGELPWGSSDMQPPVIAHIVPGCGTTGVPGCTDIIIKVGDLGCSGLSLDCVRIYINGGLKYSGAGLVFGVNHNMGWAPACAATSDITEEISSIYTTLWVFKVSCGCLPCSSKISLTATFCDLAGNTLNISCAFSTIECLYIKNVQTIDSRHFVIKFSNQLDTNLQSNPALYNIASYSVSNNTGGTVDGHKIRVKKVFIPQGNSIDFVMVETDQVYEQAGYQFSAVDIVDIYKQPIIERGMGRVAVRTTKLDGIMRRLPATYSSIIDFENNKEVHPFHLFAVLGLEDDKIGGDF